MAALVEDLHPVAGLELLQKSSDLQRFSRDAFDYSPVLKARLEHCQADLVVRPWTSRRLKLSLPPVSAIGFP